MECEPERHRMVLIATHKSGADEWYCPTCGRRFLLARPPNYQRNILEAGDETAVHCGGLGELEIQVTEIRQDEGGASLDDLSLDDPYLAPWQEWMDQVGFESRWKADD